MTTSTEHAPPSNSHQAISVLLAQGRAEYDRRVDFPAVVQLGKTALERSQQTIPLFTEGIIESHILLARAYTAMDDYEHAMACLTALDEWVDMAPFPSYRYHVCHIGGALAFRAGEYASALEKGLQALSILDELGDTPSEWRFNTLNGIGLVFNEVEDADYALQYLRQALDIAQQDADPYKIANVLINLGETFRKNGDLGNAIQHNEQALQLADQHDFAFLRAYACVNLGTFYLQQGQLDIAQKHLTTSLDIAERLQIGYILASARQRLAAVNIQKGALDAAHPLLVAALVQANSIQYHEVTVRCHETFAAYYQASGNYQKALEHYQEFHSLQASMLNQSVRHRVMLMEFQHQLAQAEQTTQIHKLESERLKANLEQQSRTEKERIQRAVAAYTNAKDTELSEVKTRFMSRISHEFRTPMSVIQSSVSLIERKLKSDDPFYGRQFERIEKGIGRLTELLADFSTVISDLDRHLHVEPRAINLRQLLVDSVAEAHTKSETDRRVRIQADGLPDTFVSDPALLHDVLVHLLTNGLKFSAPDQPITLALRGNGAGIVCEVIDHGIGIAEEDQPHIFELLYRGSNIDEVWGMGVGLSIVKSYIDILNGDITFHNNPQGGTTFRIEIPHWQSK